MLGYAQRQHFYLEAMGIKRWVLRQPVDVEKNTEAVNTHRFIDWYTQQEQARVIFLADVSSTEQELFNAITQACAKEQTHSCGKLQTEIHSAQDFITTFPMSCTHILVFGIQQARLLDPTFTKPGIFSLGSVKICVTYTLQELNTQPTYKRELWQTWKTL